MSTSHAHHVTIDDAPLGGPMRPEGQGLIPAAARRDDIAAIRRDLMEGEQIYGTFGNGTGDMGLLGITNRRLMFVNFGLGDDRVGLTSTPLKNVVAVSYITHPSVPLTESTVVGIQIGRSVFEIGCEDPEEARNVHGLIMWHLIGL